MTCGRCGHPISAARQAALPGETWCKDCVEATGDVERIKGAMTWEHKPAPTLVLGKDAETVLRYARRGVHADLPLGSTKR
jgi:hypothetical protein